MITAIRRQLTMFGRICARGFRNFFRNAWLTTAAIAMMFVTLTIALSGIIINLAFNDTLEGITEDITVSIYLHDDAPENEVALLRTQLTDSPAVNGVTYRSKEEALKRFQEQNADNQQIIQGLSVTENILPASFEVVLGELSQLDEVLAIANSEIYADTVEDTSDNSVRRKSIERIDSWQRFATSASIAAGATFAFISVLIIFNTIRMAIYTRSYEIEIMKLVGATPGYIRGPFLFEAALYGVIAGTLSFVAVYSAILTIAENPGNQIAWGRTIELFTQYWYVVLAVAVGVGMLLGYFSSVIAMARYLRLRKW